MQGGLEQQMPHQAAVIALALPSLSYVATTTAGVGKMIVLGPIDFFIINLCQ
jgi:hypothetical protein